MVHGHHYLIYYQKGLYSDTLITIASLVNIVLFIHTCINANILFNATSENLYILRARPSVWMPRKLSRPWQDPSVLILVQKLTESTGRRTHWLIAFIIAVIMGISALTATAAAARLALHKEMQTAEVFRLTSACCRTLGPTE